jgi:predicted extracellular nuclease
VALLVRPDEFTVTGSRVIPVIFSFSPTDKTRDILCVTGTMDDGNVYHIYVNHWPSRSGDAIQSEMRRMTAAATLRKDIDAVLRTEAEARIIIIGDFNDEPTNRSLMQILNATNKRINTTSSDLYNLMYDKHNIENKGTLTYQGQWDMFDQIIVSWPLLNKSGGYYTDFEGGSVHTSDNLLFTNPENGFKSPNRTFGGNEYFGGVSDHLPVFVVLKKDESGK